MPLRKLFDEEGNFDGLGPLEAANVGITLTDPNQPGNPIIYANQAFYRMTGYGPDEVLGRNCKFLQGAETNSATVEMIKAALDQRCDCKVVIRNYQRNGNTFWNELTIAPVFNQKRELAYFLGFQQDVTQRVLAEEALRRSEQRVQSIIDASNEFIWEMNHEGVITRVSEKIKLTTGYDQRDLIGKSFWDFATKDSMAQTEAMIRSIVAEGRAFSQKRIRVLDAQGNRMWLNISGKPFFDNDGQFVSFVGAGSDITEQQLKLTDAARFASLGEIVGNISHEIRNPVTVIKGQLERMASKLDSDGALDPTATKKTISKMLAACDRLEKISTETRDVILRKSNKPAEPTDLVKVVREAERNLRDRLGQSQTDFQIEVDTSDQMAAIRTVQFTQVLQNLIGNACDAIAKRGIKWIRVAIEDGPTDDMIQLSVTDSGPGIPKELRQKIMEPLFTTKGDDKGTGLGLALCQNIIEGLNGVFYLDEDHPNTRFVIQIPRNANNKTQADKAA